MTARPWPARPCARTARRTPRMVDALRALVEVESPTSDAGACAACAAVADELASALLGRARRAGRGWRPRAPALAVRRPPRVLLIGHLDTVWPLGTLARWPFELRGGVATGPGVFDMKAGSSSSSSPWPRSTALDGVAVLLTSDEEIGSPTSRRSSRQRRRGSRRRSCSSRARGRAEDGAKGRRRSTASRSAAARRTPGLDPERGANAAVELAHQLLAIAALAGPSWGRR